jgi:ABC-type transport system substrate-binding protein
MSNKLTIAIGGIAAVLILALAGVLLLVVAGGDDGDKDDPNGGPAAEATSNDGDDDDDGDDGDDPPAGSGELRLRGDDPLFLDPAVIQDAGSAYYAVEIFSGLVRLDKDLQIQPDIAMRWDISPDGKVYTFHINPDATFHDGRPVLASDFKLSWERALNPETASVVAENFLGDIAGARDVSSRAAAPPRSLACASSMATRRWR